MVSLAIVFQASANIRDLQTKNSDNCTGMVSKFCGFINPNGLLRKMYPVFAPQDPVISKLY